MARVDNLINFLTDVADAIREKKGTSEIIKASNFDTEIANIQNGLSVETATLILNDMGGGSILQNTYMFVFTYENDNYNIKIFDSNDFFNFIDYQVTNALIGGFIILINTSYGLSGNCVSKIFGTTASNTPTKIYKIIESNSYDITLEGETQPVGP